MAAGNAALLAELGIAKGALEEKADALRRDGATALFVAVDGKPAGIVAVADPIKASTPAALQSLRQSEIGRAHV